LDAILIGGSPNPEVAVAQVVGRRPPLSDAPYWLHHRRDRAAGIRIALAGESGPLVTTHISVREGPVKRPGGSFPDDGSRVPVVEVRRTPGHGLSNCVAFHPDFSIAFHTEDSLGVPFVPGITFVDPAFGGTSWSPPSLVDVYSEAVRRGQKRAVEDILRTVLPDLDELRVLTTGGVPGLDVGTRNGSVPVGLEGEGIQALIRLALELAAAPGGGVRPRKGGTRALAENCLTKHSISEIADTISISAESR